MNNTAINIEFVPFSDSLAHHFSTLNGEWLKKFFVIEPIDKEMLDNPRHYFIDKGGYIFFAKANDEIAGTFALLKISDSIYELSKMAVAEKFQGMKVGNKIK